MINIITTSFPYGDKEPFLETEIKHATTPIRIFAINNDRDDLRDLPKNIKVYSKRANRTLYSIMKYCIIITLQKDFYIELKEMKKSKKLSICNITTLLRFMIKCHENKTFVLKNIDRWEANEIIYSYWLYEHAYTGILLKRKIRNIKVITRAHRFDVYEESHVGNYIPLRYTLLNELDYICPISDHGAQYLKQKYTFDNSKITVSKLGTEDCGFAKQKFQGNQLHIVSCSWMVRVKRLDRIIDSLSSVPKQIHIKWTHIGNGDLYQELLEYAKKKINSSNNISFVFTGGLSNEEVKKRFSEGDFHFLINTSESEGLPVSMMEASSFGIPIIGTDVGGVNEIIIEGRNGFLLPNNELTASALTETLVKISGLKDKEYFALRAEARQHWETHFSSKVNYEKFYDFLNSL